MPLRISAFPKCYLEEIVAGKMSVFQWIGLAQQLDADGLEMYSGFFTSFDNAYIDSVGEAIAAAGFAMPMLCCSPDLTAPDADQRKREIEREAEMIAVTRRLGGQRSVCRILTGQRYPDVSWEQGREWVLQAIDQLLPVARQLDVVLGLENHYKDSFWRYPEFAQKMERFVAIVAGVSDRTHFGVQYDPSNAIVAGDDPIQLLEAVAERVVSMHASDRYMAEGTLQHGVTGKGLNDYDKIFQMLAANHFSGSVSIEDGMNGMGEMAESLAFLRAMSARYFA
jgi:sugar phosphate isomerase/epimerase